MEAWRLECEMGGGYASQMGENVESLWHVETKEAMENLKEWEVVGDTPIV